jgi:hypothetical protein
MEKVREGGGGGFRRVGGVEGRRLEEGEDEERRGEEGEWIG